MCGGRPAQLAVLFVGFLSFHLIADAADQAAIEPIRSAAAERFRSGLDAWARMDGAEVFRQMRASLEADPSYLPPLLEMARYAGWGVMLPNPERAFFETLARGHGEVAGCARIVLEQADLREAEPPDDDDDVGVCAGLRPLLGVYPPLPPEETALLAEQLWAAYPASPAATILFGRELARAGQWSRIDAVVRESERLGPHPIVKTVLDGLRIDALHGRGLEEEAHALERDVRRALQTALPGIVETFRGSAGHGFAISPNDVAAAAHVDSVRVWVREVGWRLVTPRDTVRRIARLHEESAYLLGQGRLAESLPIWSELLDLATSLDLPDWQARALLGRGRALVKLGESEAAEEALLEAREVAAKGRSFQPRYEVEHNLLHLYEARGEDSLARDAGEAFVEATRRATLTPVRMMSYHDFGTYLRRAGAHEEAVTLFEAMVATIDSLGSYDYYAGEYYETVGELDRARQYYLRQSPTGQAWMRAAEGMVRVSELTGDTAEAIRWARTHDARLVREYPEYRPLLPGILARTGRDAEARRAFREARSDVGRNGQTASWARLSTEQARWELERSRAAVAAALADSARAWASSVADFETAAEARALHALAELLAGSDGYREVLTEIRGALADARRAKLPGLRFEVLLIEARAHLFARHTEETLSTLRRAAELASEIGGSLRNDADQAGYRAAQARVSDLAMSAVLGARGGPSASDWIEWSIRRKAAPRLDGRAFPSPREVQGWLAPDQAAIDYFVTPREIAALVVTSDSIEVLTLPVTPTDLRSLTIRLAGRIAPRVGGQIDVSRSQLDTDAAARLYQALIEPAAELLDGRQRITVIPDGSLHYLPFDALLTGEDEGSGFMVERYEIDIARSIEGERGPSRGFRSVLVMATSAPGLDAQKEADAVSRAAEPMAATVLAGSRATEEALSARAPGFSILHIAGHARANQLNPDFGYVRLHASEISDGRLDAGEIRELSLSGVDLVVLSACGTAGGRLLLGEGVMSLGRAFLQAGAARVVGSLWPVGPLTVPLMESFYGGLSQGESAAAALRTAKLELLSSRDASPLHWAAFILISPGLEVGGGS
jgi:tetratricopeptide (TPR) repeat protein